MMNCSSFSSGGPARALLVCITEAVREASRPYSPSPLEAAGARLVGCWREAERPAAFVEPDPAPSFTPSYTMLGVAAAQEGGGALESTLSDPSRGPHSSDFVIGSPGRSLLGQWEFVRLFEALGAPLLILLGDELGEVVLQTAIDGFLAGYPIIIVKDAAPPGFAPSAETEASRRTALPLLACFARLMTARELMREWTGAE